MTLQPPVCKHFTVESTSVSLLATFIVKADFIVKYLIFIKTLIVRHVLLTRLEGAELMTHFANWCLIFFCKRAVPEDGVCTQLIPFTFYIQFSDLIKCCEIGKSPYRGRAGCDTRARYLVNVTKACRHQFLNCCKIENNEEGKLARCWSLCNYVVLCCVVLC